MANTFLTPTHIANQALATLHEELVMRQLVHTDLTREFASSKVGDTVNIRKPATFVAHDFKRETPGITIQDAKEESIPVQLNHFKDVSFAVTSEDLMLNIDDFDEQLLTPAMQALAVSVDSALIAEAQTTPNVVGIDGEATWDKPEVLIEAGRVLDTNSVPTLDRYAVVGSYTKAKWIHTPLLKAYEQAGDTEALRRASLGRELFGFKPYMTQLIKPPVQPLQPGDPTTEVSLAFHKSAIAFASAPMSVPPGADGAIASHKGLSLRVTRDYSQEQKQTIISVDLLFGTKVLDPNRVVLIKGADQA